VFFIGGNGIHRFPGGNGGYTHLKKIPQRRGLVKSPGHPSRRLELVEWLKTPGRGRDSKAAMFVMSVNDCIPIIVDGVGGVIGRKLDDLSVIVVSHDG